MKFSEERNEIFAAYTKAWGEIKTLVEKKEVKIDNYKDPKKSYSYSYTDLTDIYDDIREVLEKHDLGVMHDTRTRFDERAGYDKNELNTLLIHPSGQYIESDYIGAKAIYDIKTDYNKNQFTVANMKENGGQFTYLRRFSILATFGLATDKAREQERGNPMFDAPGPEIEEDRFGHKEKAAREAAAKKENDFIAGKEQKEAEKNKPEPTVHMIPIKDIEEMERLFIAIAEKQGGDPNLIWGRIIELYPALNGAYKDLTYNSGKKVLNLLKKFESGELSIWQNQPK